MSLSLILAAAVLASPAPQTPAAPPQMRVAIGDLDFARAADQQEFVRRVHAASRDFCRDHLEVVTPDRLGDPAICRAEMRWQAYRALPEPRRRQFALTGQMRAVR
jgi:UrcA family protein